MCNVPIMGLKCCKDGLIFKNRHCDTIGCEHDTLSISNKAWDYWKINSQWLLYELVSYNFSSFFQYDVDFILRFSELKQFFS